MRTLVGNFIMLIGIHLDLALSSRNPFENQPPRQNRVNNEFDLSTGPTKIARVGVFLQVFNQSLLSPLRDCSEAVAQASISWQRALIRSVQVDVHLSLFETNADEAAKIERGFYFNGVNRVFTNVRKENVGADVGQFLSQISLTEENNLHYDIILKMHTKSDDIWRERALESLCSSENQVVSIFNEFDRNPHISMVAPLGTTFSSRTNDSDIFPHIVHKYATAARDPLGPRAFDANTVQMVNRVTRVLGWGQIPRSSFCIIAGTMWWARYSALRPADLAKKQITLESHMTRGYRENHGAEHALERAIPSSIILNGGHIYEMPPAPKVMAIYFPQFHSIPENDKFWGDNFTEWTLLKPFSRTPVQKPLDRSEGGLGYYDLTSVETRRNQSELAKHAGVHGFMFYHYWFDGPSAPAEHKLLHKIPELMAFVDGEPSLPFMFSWANEPWAKRWDGGDHSVLISQEYGNELDWVKHFDYLSDFFVHPKYIKIGGCPVFAIYRLGHLGEKLIPMIALWTKLAQSKLGVPGLHIINTAGIFFHE